MFDYESAPESIIKNRNLRYNFYFFYNFILILKYKTIIWSEPKILDKKV